MDATQTYDVVILGTGPAGIQAAIHAVRKKVSVIVLGKESNSSLYRAHVENVAFISDLSGEEMLKKGRLQAQTFGATFLEEDILRIEQQDGRYQVATEGGGRIDTGAIVIATGTSRNTLGVPGEKELLGKGVSYCTDCDGNFFRGEAVAIIGNESAAADAALTMTQIAHSVHLIFDQMKVTAALETKLRDSTVIVHPRTSVKAILGTQSVEALMLSDGQRLDLTGVFIELGAKGIKELVLSLGLQLDDEMKYVSVNRKQETNLPGIYAAGDICGPPWQIAKAVGEGCVAGLEAAGYAKKQRLSNQGDAGSCR
jgi:thioredoxin reductase (NADPH)